MRPVDDLELDRVRGGILDWLFKSVTTPDDPFYHVNIGTLYRRRQLIAEAKLKCGKEADPDPAAQEACLVRSGVRGPGFPRE